MHMNDHNGRHDVLIVTIIGNMSGMVGHRRTQNKTNQIVYFVNKTPKRCYGLCRRKLEVIVVFLESKAMKNCIFLHKGIMDSNEGPLQCAKIYDKKNN